MAKLNKEQVIAVLAEKGFRIKDINAYETIKSPITVICSADHQIHTTLETARKQRFVCPQCDGGVYKYTKNGQPPIKKGVRVLGFDNATKMMGVSEVDVVVSGVGSGRESSIRAFSSKGIGLSSITDKTPIPHNGPKPKKPRRV